MKKDRQRNIDSKIYKHVQKLDRGIDKQRDIDRK